jgi:uncharacterized protein (TIGR02569 family)
MAPPAPEIVQAFGHAGASKAVIGGRGLCYLVGEAIFKPSDNDNESQWTAELVNNILLRSPSLYRLARPFPITHKSNCFVFNGWTASSFLPGTAGPSGRFREVITLSRAFHADLAEVMVEKPTAIVDRSNRWCEADKVAWGEKDLKDVPRVDKRILEQLSPTLEKLSLARQPVQDFVKSQLIHADLAGNILFSDEPRLTPAIIDLTFYWKPVEYAEAIVVADGLTWCDESFDLLEFYGTDELRRHMLVKALYWRCLTWAIDPDLEWIYEKHPDFVERYQKAADIVCRV